MRIGPLRLERAAENRAVLARKRWRSQRWWRSRASRRLPPRAAEGAVGVRGSAHPPKPWRLLQALTVSKSQRRPGP